MTTLVLPGFSSSDSEYVPYGSRRVFKIDPGLRARYLFSLAASASFSMSEQKEVQLLPLASLISFLYASLIALDKSHSSSVLPFLARLNLSLVSLRSFSSCLFHQWVSRAFLIFEGKQLSSYVIIMADENWSAAFQGHLRLRFPWFSRGVQLVGLWNNTPSLFPRVSDPCGARGCV